MTSVPGTCIGSERREPTPKLISVIIPVCNELLTLEEVVGRVLVLSYPIEVIVVDDGSTDGTTERLQLIASNNEVHAIFHAKNLGKGAAIRSALPHASGEIIIIQDADLEYDPADIANIIRPIIEDRADVVYGSRFLIGGGLSVPWTHRIANKVLTQLSNSMTGLSLTDMETCYKAMQRKVVERLELCEARFGIEPELTAKIARQQCRILEVPISYTPRSVAAGKKVRFIDGIRAIWCICRYSYWK